MANYKPLTVIKIDLMKLFINQIQAFKYDIIRLEIDKISEYLINNEFDNLKRYIDKIGIEPEQYYILSGIISQLELINYLLIKGV